MTADTLFSKIRYMLLQVRNRQDRMREHEVGCFARALRCRREQIRVFDLLSGVPSKATLDTADVVLLGGAGEYSVAEGGEWLPPALEAMRELDAFRKPTFASCWGFQAMARALGGEVVTDRKRAEVGTLQVGLTGDGRRDPIFGPLKNPFWAQMGHEDIVVRLPRDAVLLARTERVENQAFCIAGKPIYCTQFHPELRQADLLIRLQAYPRYVEEVSGLTLEEFRRTCRDTPEIESVLPRFVETVMG